MDSGFGAPASAATRARRARGYNRLRPSSARTSSTTTTMIRIVTMLM
jgi:hypothetical protein